MLTCFGKLTSKGFKFKIATADSKGTESKTMPVSLEPRKTYKSREKRSLQARSVSTIFIVSSVWLELSLESPKS